MSDILRDIEEELHPTQLMLVMRELKKASPQWEEIDVWVKVITRRTRAEVALGRMFFKKQS